VNNVPVPLGLDQEIACIMRLIAEARARRAAVCADRRRDREISCPARHCLSRHRPGRRLQELVHQPAATPLPWPFPQSEHKAFFEPVPVEDFDFISIE
jgi:hypothetical protein